MWLRNYPSARHWAPLALVMLGLSALSGCGFTPLYGTSMSGASVTVELSSITVADIKTRIAQQVRNRLLSILGASGAGARYRLEIFPFESERDILVRSDADVKRRIYNLRVTYKLFNASNKKPVTSGAVLAVASYIRVQSEFANVRSKLDAENRAAVAAADDVKIRLAAFFAAR